jgi:small subunit ribosomal protein S6
MSKTKKSDKTHYELLYIIPNKFTEDEAKTIDEKIKTQITSSEGEITYFEDWGKKKLAYVINGNNYGYYKLLEIDLFGKDLAKLDNFFRLSNEILRHQIIKKVKRTAEEIESDKKKSEELAKNRRKQREGGEAEVEKKAPVVASEVKPQEERKSSKKKTDLKDLDKKLDDILDTNDLI